PERDAEATVMGVSMFGQQLHEAKPEISCAGHSCSLQPRAGSIALGRSAGADLPVNDSRVSRLHASIEWRGGHFVLSDASSFGTWVYFGNQPEPVVLCRTECYLVGQGQIALGCDRNAEAVPIATFSVA